MHEDPVSDPPRTPESARRRWALLLLGLLALPAGWALWRAGVPTRRESTADGAPIPVPSRPVAGPTSTEVDVPMDVETLHVWLRDLDDTRYVHAVPGAPFAEVWPAAGDEAWDHTRLDGLQAPAAIRSLSGPGTPFKNRRGAQVLDLALGEGFGADAALETPEDALVGLYTAWVEAEVRYEQDWRTFEAEHLPDGLRRSDLDPEQLHELFAQPGKPIQDVRALQGVAEFALARWPDHPVADHARLAQLRSARAYGHEWDPDLLSELLGQIASPVLREQGALLVTNLRDTTPELLDRMFAIEAREPRDGLRLATWGMAGSVKIGDWARAEVWAERTRPVTDEVCASVSDGTQVVCDFAQYQLRETAARLVALGRQPAVTWQEALTAAAWRCHIDAPAEPGSSRTHTTWTGERWVFEPWDRPSVVTDCLDALHTTEMVPESPLRVRLTVETTG